MAEAGTLFAAPTPASFASFPGGVATSGSTDGSQARQGLHQWRSWTLASVDGVDACCDDKGSTAGVEGNVLFKKLAPIGAIPAAEATPSSRNVNTATMKAKLVPRPTRHSVFGYKAADLTGR